MPHVSPTASDYTVVVTREHLRDGRVLFLATCPELPGCMTHAATETEARLLIREAIAITVEHLSAHGLPVPAPRAR